MRPPAAATALVVVALAGACTASQAASRAPAVVLTLEDGKGGRALLAELAATGARPVAVTFYAGSAALGTDTTPPYRLALRLPLRRPARLNVPATVVRADGSPPTS